MVLKKKVEKELRELSNKNIRVIINPHKKRRGVHSLSFLSFRYIEFDGPIDFDNVELKGAIAHELGHIEERHFLIEFLALIIPDLILLAATVMFLLQLSASINPYYVTATLFAFVIVLDLVVYTSLGRLMERRADLFAVKIVGKKSIIKVLKKVRNWKEVKIDLTHENINSRIKRLENLPSFSSKK